MSKDNSRRMYPSMYSTFNTPDEDSSSSEDGEMVKLTRFKMSEEDSSRTYSPVYPMSTPMPSQGSTNPTMQTNPLQYPAQNTSASANAMPTPTPRGNPPLHSNLGSLGGPANPPMQTNLLQYPAPNTSTNFMTTETFFRKNVSVIAIGNPGAGKSTILNYLAGTILFKSGVSIGEGLTYQLDARENDRGRFFDTPGLADDTHREAAAKAISTALRKGGPFKIIFFVRLFNGRIVREDITTLKLVLESAPEIGNKYGIVTNKVEREVIELLQDPNKAEKLVIKLFASIPEENRCTPSSITYLPYRPEANAKNNHLLHPNSLITSDGSSFGNFVYEEIETVELTEGQAKDIEIEHFDETAKRIEALEKRLEENAEMYKEQQRLLHQLLEKADRDKEELYARDMEKFNQQMELQLDRQMQDFQLQRTEQAQLHKQQMEKKDKEMAAARNDALSREQRQQEQFNHATEELNQFKELDRKKRQKKKEQCIVM